MNRYKANVSIFSLMLVFFIIFTMVMIKDKLLYQEKMSVNVYQNYLIDKFKITEINSPNFYQRKCEEIKEENVIIEYTSVSLAFNCRYLGASLFVDNILPTKKYLDYADIDEVLNLNNFEDHIYNITTLKDLPSSSLENPKIVRVMNDIHERLESDFYGIIITQYPFRFTKKKIYGLFISPYAEDAEYRNISRNNKVIENLNELFSKLSYSSWDFVPNSIRIVSKDE